MINDNAFTAHTCFTIPHDSASANVLLLDTSVGAIYSEDRAVISISGDTAFTGNSAAFGGKAFVRFSLIPRKTTLEACESCVERPILGG